MADPPMKAEDAKCSGTSCLFLAPDSYVNACQGSASSPSPEGTLVSSRFNKAGGWGLWQSGNYKRKRREGETRCIKQTGFLESLVGHRHSFVGMIPSWSSLEFPKSPRYDGFHCPWEFSPVCYELCTPQMLLLCLPTSWVESAYHIIKTICIY